MNKTACRTIETLLPLYADDRLCEEARCLTEQHLQTCSDCRSAYARLCRMKAFRQSGLLPDPRTEESV